jgi:hypothetical protein
MAGCESRLGKRGHTRRGVTRSCRTGARHIHEFLTGILAAVLYFRTELLVPYIERLLHDFYTFCSAAMGTPAYSEETSACMKASSISLAMASMSAQTA